MKPAAVPVAAGDPSLIEHVVYIIKENRTYDQVFGDLPHGNGDTSLLLFGEDVAPNQRRLAREFVLLDNLYATGGNSGDGHQWATQANESDYAMWPGYTGRSYPFDGADPLAYAPGGFIWDGARQMNKTVRIYGEFVPAERGVAPKEREALLQEWEKGADFSNRWKPTPRVQGMGRVSWRRTSPLQPGDSGRGPCHLFLRDLRAWEQARHDAQSRDDACSGQSHVRHRPDALHAAGDGRRQRSGRRPRRRGPHAQPLLAAHGDLRRRGRCAGRGGSRCGHRTVALAVSPYVRRHHVDSTFYSQAELLKTIELMLGLPPLSIFDRIAIDMRASFTDEPDLAPYTAVVPAQFACTT